MDKLSAYQTLYTVLTTLCKLLAPVVPFFTESMYQNLVKSFDTKAPESVHHCDYPQANSTMTDEKLSTEMEALLRIVSLGSAARNTAKMKVRQPLAELKVQPADEADRSAVLRFADQIKEELNVKKVSVHDNKRGKDPLAFAEIKANLKSLGAKAGPKLQQVKKIVETQLPNINELNRGEIPEVIIEVDGVSFSITTADYTRNYRGPENWTVALDKNETVVAIDTRLTKELKQEGLAREVIRQVQEFRKKSDLQMEDRIALHLATSSQDLSDAIATFKDYIANETLTKEWPVSPLPDGFSTEVKAEGMGLTLSLKKL